MITIVSVVEMCAPPVHGISPLRNHGYPDTVKHCCRRWTRPTKDPKTDSPLSYVVGKFLPIESFLAGGNYVTHCFCEAVVPLVKCHEL